uniref:macro domain-containing protein n=1 Tax=Limnohabitans sp. TaxID=1907725 RepID=UPI0040481745
TLGRGTAIEGRIMKWLSGTSNRGRFIDLAVAQTLRVAKEAGIKSMAMPAIGTGVFKFPPELAAQIICRALLSRAADYSEISLVRICVGDEPMRIVFHTALLSLAMTSSVF